MESVSVMASCGALEVTMEGLMEKGKGEPVSVEEALETLRSSLLGELQDMREKVVLMEEKMDILVQDRLQQHEAAVCSWLA